MFKLFNRDIYIRRVVNELFKLSGWIISSVDWVHDMRILHFRIVLCHYWPKCSDRSLHRGLVLCCVCDHMFDLSRRVFLCDFRLVNLHLMHFRVILWRFGTECSVRCMLIRLVFRYFSHCVFKLLKWHLFPLHFFYKLLKLSRRIISIINWIVVV